MDSLISFLCLSTFFVPTALGVGITLLLERSIGGRAYVVGWLLPLILLFGFFVAGALWMRATPCEPARSLECGEPAAYALILFIVVFCLTAGANTIAQIALFWFWRWRRQGQSLA